MVPGDAPGHLNLPPNGPLPGPPPGRSWDPFFATENRVPGTPRDTPICPRISRSRDRPRAHLEELVPQADHRKVHQGAQGAHQVGLPGLQGHQGP